MANILLVEPNYRSKFPPLGLMRIATYHKMRGDTPVLVRGHDRIQRADHWHRVYVSSLFTYELPKTVAAIKYYAGSVDSPNDIVVGGIGVTLIPEYVRERVSCRIITGPIDQPGMLDADSPPISTLTPDYAILDKADYEYEPRDAYFCRLTVGCVRRCGFCAVPRLEPTFCYVGNLEEQITAVKDQHGAKRNLVLMDNNILALPKSDLDGAVDRVVGLGFGRGSRYEGRLRHVDFNQGIDARLVNEDTARALSRLPLSPIRLAFDSDGVEKDFVRASTLLADHGFSKFTNYVMYNFDDDPKSFYTRLRKSIELANSLGVRISSFPMRYIPVTDTRRGHIGPRWEWRTLRGIQCISLATHGIVSPNLEFFEHAFGKSPDDFIQITSMPDRYIINRERHENAGAHEWRREFGRLSESEKMDFLSELGQLHDRPERRSSMIASSAYRNLLGHYYNPDGRIMEDQDGNC